jgi:hypothetical protein
MATVGVVSAARKVMEHDDWFVARRMVPSRPVYAHRAID